MSFVLPQLPYAYDALEPFIDKETMMIHHTKHHQTYIDKLNAGIQGTEYEGWSIEDLLTKIDSMPENLKGIIRNHGGGYYNHMLFWNMMSPSPSQPSAQLLSQITTSFGSMDLFKEQFTTQALANFGSGWTWLVEKGGELKIINTPNQDCPISQGYTILLGLDVWEHAYYLKYQNRRAEYVSNWWNVVSWN